MSHPDTTIPDSVATSAAIPLTLRDRFLGWRDRIYSNAAFQRWAASFPLTRPIAQQRARAVFDLSAGFVYSQTLRACVQLDLFKLLGEGPDTTAGLARRTRMPVDGMDRLLRAAASLKLVQARSAGRWGLGVLGCPLVDDEAISQLVTHHQYLYEDLRDPIAILRKSAGETALSKYWPYADANKPQEIESAEANPYTSIMAITLPPLAEDVLDHYDLGRHKVLLDVGGGEGVFLQHAAERHQGLQLQLFDLPAVVVRGKARLTKHGMGDRANVFGGNFHTDELPKGADIVSLVRVLLDHSDEHALGILRRVRAALPPGGTLLIAEPLAGLAGTEPIADAYFGLYLWAMGRGRARSAEEHQKMLATAGFSRSRVVGTRYPVWASVIIATA